MATIKALAAVPFDDWWCDLGGGVVVPVVAWAVTNVPGPDDAVEPVVVNPATGNIGVPPSYNAILDGNRFGDKDNYPSP